MTLTPALLARLKRRGIVRRDTSEEVIAENYDTEVNDTMQKNTSEKKETKNAGAKGCPNKWNPYHLCVKFCYERWKDGTNEDSLPQKYAEQRLKALKRYPLPPEWKEVYDPGCARHYYWCTRTDEVSWLPPRHPLAVIGDAAPKVAKEIHEKNRENAQGIETNVFDSNTKKGVESHRDSRIGATFQDSKRRRRHNESESDEDKNRSDLSGSDEERRIELSDRDKLKRARRKGIDPMDPAAYGDNVAVGKWSSGLHAHDKTGADVTASGPLFQQRPYPAPGAVLRKEHR